MRRYAPWNGFLRSREQERAVIQAGSVLQYKVTNIDPTKLPKVIGQYQEAGLGRIWINPKLLSAYKPKADENAEPLIKRKLEEIAPAKTWPQTDELKKKDKFILGWMVSQAGLRDHSRLDKRVAEWTEELDHLYASAKLLHGANAGPSSSQWGAIRAAAEKADTVEALNTTLFGPDNSICGAEEGVKKQTTKEAWLTQGQLNGNLTSFREWLKSKLENKDLTQDEKLDDPHMLRAIPLIVKVGQGNADKEAGKAK